MIPLERFKDLSVYVVGLGKSGQATVAALTKAGTDLYFFDDAQKGGVQPDQVPWSDLDYLVLSPGIPHTYPKPHKAAQLARDHNVPIICDVDLLAQACPGATYVSMTGTNGKSTTTALLNHLLPLAQMGGNIGRPVLTLEPFDKKEDIYLLELSSYQLERVPHLRSDVVVWLNITPDHLERHKDMVGYVAAKRNIFADFGIPQQVVIGIDDPDSLTIFKELEKDLSKRVTSLSLCQKTDKGLSVLEGILYDEGVFVADLNDFKALPGVHNHQNIAAAYGVLKALNQSFDWERVTSFKGLPHRQEIIAQQGNVLVVNDSKSTNIVSTLRALACYKFVYLIVGGIAKASALQGLEDYKGVLEHVFVFGQAASKFSDDLKEKNIPHSVCDTLKEATLSALSSVSTGTIFDQFKSFEDRGDAFKEYVKTAYQRREGPHV